ncbi:hypothetical protein SALBM311S_02120 [Streptomyces alboniger]
MSSSTRARLHRREVDAYRKWTVSLGEGRTPDLTAAEAVSHTILVTAVPGHSLDSLRLPAEQKRKAYEQAGELLARHHAAAGGEPAADTSEGEWEETVSKVLVPAAAYVPEHELSTVRALLSEPPHGYRRSLDTATTCRRTGCGTSPSKC